MFFFGGGVHKIVSSLEIRVAFSVFIRFIAVAAMFDLRVQPRPSRYCTDGQFWTAQLHFKIDRSSHREH